MVGVDLPVVRVKVVSGHPVVRAGVQSLLERHAEQVLLVDGCAAADVVVYDVHALSDGDGDDLRLLVKRHPGRVVALSRSLQPGLVARALGLGAVVSVSMASDDQELLELVLAVAAGSFEDGSEADLANRRTRDHDLGRDVRLTAREEDVLALVVAGHSNAAIAELLFLSPNTVKSFIRTAYAKIGASTRSQAVAWGIQHGYPTSDETGDARPER
jgi:DNA-binding NarL/FixJ family response regulator